jgi:hypothetical protein
MERKRIFTFHKKVIFKQNRKNDILIQMWHVLKAIFSPFYCFNSNFISCISNKITIVNCLIFRFSEGTSADREIQRTLMELLNQMDGFDVLGQVSQFSFQIF